MSYEVAIHQFEDARVGITYGFLLHSHQDNKTLAIDAGAARPLLDLLESRAWSLDELWITHHHFDHTDGLMEVKQATGCRVTGPKNQTKPIEGLDRLVEEGDPLSFARFDATIIHAPGHTNDMLNYHFPQLGICFVGDVLFPLGCGRINEGTPEELWTSLQKIMRLPPSTQLYSCHEYAESNARFALSVEPNNRQIQLWFEAAKNRTAKGFPNVPSLLEDELRANPFLRVNEPGLRTALNVDEEVNDVEVFTALRTMKDRF